MGVFEQVKILFAVKECIECCGQVNVCIAQFRRNLTNWEGLIVWKMKPRSCVLNVMDCYLIVIL